MELPEEIVRIIREYSRPHFREYHEAVRILRAKQWPTLKHAFNDPGTRVRWKEYKEAYLDRCRHSAHASKGLLFNQQLTRKRYRERNKFHLLTLYLYGEIKERLELCEELE